MCENVECSKQMDQISEVVPVSPNLSRESGMQNWTLHLFTQQETKQSSDEEIQVSFIPIEVMNRLSLTEKASAPCCTLLFCCAEAISKHMSSAQ